MSNITEFFNDFCSGKFLETKQTKCLSYEIIDRNSLTDEEFYCAILIRKQKSKQELMFNQYVETNAVYFGEGISLWNSHGYKNGTIAVHSYKLPQSAWQSLENLNDDKTFDITESKLIDVVGLSGDRKAAIVDVAGARYLLDRLPYGAKVNDYLNLTENTGITTTFTRQIGNNVETVKDARNLAFNDLGIDFDRATMYGDVVFVETDKDCSFPSLCKREHELLSSPIKLPYNPDKRLLWEISSGGGALFRHPSSESTFLKEAWPDFMTLGEAAIKYTSFSEPSNASHKVKNKSAFLRVNFSKVANADKTYFKGRTAFVLVGHYPTGYRYGYGEGTNMDIHSDKWQYVVFPFYGGHGKE